MSPENVEGPEARRRLRWYLLGLVVVGLILRLPNYTQSVWFDEAYTSKQVLGSWFLFLKTNYVDLHPPLYQLFMYLWNSAFGDREIVMRLPSLLCGLIGIVATFRLGERLVGRRAGMVAAALMTVAPVSIWYNISSKQYSAIVLLACCWRYRLSGCSGGGSGGVGGDTACSRC